MIKEEPIIEFLKSNLSQKRYRHSIGVKEEAVKMAKMYGVDIDKARIAALAHDCVKEKTEGELIDYVKRENIAIDEVSISLPELLHGPAAVFICKNIFGIYDYEILSAVKYHTTGKENMTGLEKIIFIADFIEPERDFPGVEDIRKAAFSDLNRAMVLAFDSTISYVLKKENMIHPDTVLARNYILRNTKRP